MSNEPEVDDASLNSNVLLVLGVHRSGTSALARVLNLLGVNLGTDLMPSEPGVNERGFWESRRIVEFHDRLLDLLEIRWDDTLSLTEESWTRTDLVGVRDALTTFLREEFAGNAWWGIKDPRLCRLLPLWQLILKDLRCRSHVVFIVRNPHEVSDSLARRDGLSGAQSQLLWLEHVLAMEHDSREASRAFLTYTDLLEDWRNTIDVLATRLNIRWPRSPQTAGNEIETFLSPQLRHHRTSDVDLARDAELSPWIKDFYEGLLAAAHDGDESTLRRVADRVRRELESARNLYEPALVRAQNTLRSGEDDLRQVQKETQSRKAEIKLQRRKLRELNAHVDEQTKALKKQATDHLGKVEGIQDEARTMRDWALNQQAEIERLRGIIELRNERIDGLKVEVGRRGGEAISRWAELGQAGRDLIRIHQQLVDSQEREQAAQEEASRIRAEVNDRVTQQERELAELHQRAEATESQLRITRDETTRALAEADAVRAEIGLFHASITYRATRPVRTLWHALIRRPKRVESDAANPPTPSTHPVLEEGSEESQPLPRAQTPVVAVIGPASSQLPVFRLIENPAVSIIVPVHDQWKFTIKCLQSIAWNESSVEYEVILVDDASTDSTIVQAQRVENLQVLRLDENVGFLHACNRGALQARGQFLVFLNNDTEVHTGWLDAMADVFSSRPDAGAVGAKLLGSNHSLQEAGGIIWSDGSGWNFGRDARYDEPEYNYLKEVDYCSGACLMVDRNVFIGIGMFDIRFAPAYYEDVDLCFSIRETGKRIYYQPRAVVTHHEGMSNGTDPDRGIKRFQALHREIFVEKWQASLSRQPLPGTPLQRARQRGVGRKVLVIDARTPIIDNDAGSLRMFRILEILIGLGCDVTFSAEFPADVEYDTRRLQETGIEVIYPTSLVASLEQHLEKCGGQYDVVILSRFYVARNWTTLVREYCPRARIVLDTVDLHFVRERREADVAGEDGRELALVHNRYEELAAVADSDLTLVVSEAEKTLLSEICPSIPIDVLPTIHRTRRNTPGPEGRSGLLFIGGFQHLPNVDAIEFWAKEIHPLIQKRLPGVRVTIIGADAPSHLLEFESETLRFAGKVTDIDSHFDRNRVSIAPLRYGAGVKGKILTSMSLGLPVVTTEIGAEGLRCEMEAELLVANDPASFSDAIVRLHEDPELWSTLARNGLQLVESFFSFEAVSSTLRRVVRIDEKGDLLDHEGLSDSQRRLAREIEVYEDVEDVHDLPPIYHYWSNRYLVPILKDCGIRGINEFFLDPIAKACRRRPEKRVDIASIGAGNGDVEVWLALKLQETGLTNFRFRCLELNPKMIERGRAQALSQNLRPFVEFEQTNLEEWTADRAYSVVMANHSLHHIVGIERIFDEIQTAIGEDGSFLVNDMIGRNGHMMWPEALERVDAIWETMPDRYKFNHFLRRFEEKFENWDCSTEHNEGIRAQDILPLAMERFGFDLFCPFAGFIDVFIGRTFGRNFDADRKEDRRFIDELAEMDELDLHLGKITPTHMLAVMRGYPIDAPRIYRHWSPEFCVRDPGRGSLATPRLETSKFVK